MHPLFTFGHGRLVSEELAALLRGAGIERVVDVRRFPGSRANEAAAKGAIPTLLGQLHLDYRWDARLGGRRRLSAEEDARSADPWWQVKAFRAYAAWTRSDEFRAAMADLLGEARDQRTAVMCSEAVWWRCHRRIIADVAVLAHDVPVEHLMHSGKLTAHRPSEGARVVGREVVWDR